MKKLLITGWIPDECLAPYKKQLDICIPDKEKDSFSLEEVKAVIGDYDALFTVAGFQCKKELIDSAPNMKVVGNLGVGYDNIDWRYASEKGIFIVNTPTTVCEPTAEFSIALIMAITRGIVMYDKHVRRTRNCKTSTFFDRDIMLFGKTLGILGFGRIGRAVAKKAQGLGMNVIYYDPFRQTSEKEKELNVKYSTFNELVSTADVISCHMPYTNENHHLIDKNVFKMMKNTAYFVNVARGPIMNEADLVEALKTEEIRGAATDVYEFEPIVSEELAALDNVVLSPHIGSNVLEARKNMTNEVMTGICDILSGRQPHNTANPELFKTKR